MRNRPRTGKSEAMEHINSLILRGCKLARDLESQLPNMVNQPDAVLKSCDNIISVFAEVRDLLNARGSSLGGTHEGAEVPGGFQEWLRYGCASAMGLLQTQISGPPQKAGRRIGDVTELQAVDSGAGPSSSSQRHRRRRDEVDRRRELVPVPRMGNTEIPPEDGYTWRKYGQKEILGSRFSRSYYRCTHQKLYHCPAKKQVQRLDNDPSTFEVIYRGDHTCHMSSTAPSAHPISAVDTTLPPPAASTSVPGGWLSMHIKTSGEGPSARFDTQPLTYRDFGLGCRAGTTSSGAGSTMVSSGAGPSTVRYADCPLPVADLADAMFNPGSSGSNSMDLIFSSIEERWEQQDKQN
ncbi:hypothetical protein NMG60_11012087 [Bertholletia excelsa]